MEEKETKKEDDREPSSLPSFEERLNDFIGDQEELIREAEERSYLIRFLKKYEWINEYIRSIQVFSTNEIYQAIKDDRKPISWTTLSRYLRQLYKLGIICFRGDIKTNARNVHLWFIPNVNPTEYRETLGFYNQQNKEKRKKTPEEIKREQDRRTYEQVLGAYEGKKKAREEIEKINKELAEKRNELKKEARKKGYDKEELERWVNEKLEKEEYHAWLQAQKKLKEAKT